MTKTTKTTQTATNRESSAGLVEITEATKNENHGNPECKPRVPQTTGLAIPDRMSQEPNRNCSDKLVQMNFIILGLGFILFGWIFLL